MADPKIEPTKITKPIQLLAAWLAGLVLINGAFLTAAGVIYNPSWAAGVLVVASVANVPLFLLCLFLLQTKFRPEMQEDEFYHRYLDKRFSSLTGKSEVVERKFADASVAAVSPAPREPLRKFRRVRPPLHLSAIETQEAEIQINDLLPFFRMLMDDLILAGVKPSETFGSTSKEPVIPKPLILSVGEDVPIDLAKKVLSVVKKYDFEGIAYTRNDAGIHYKKVYVGAYSYENGARPFLRLDEATTKKLLAPDATKAIWDSMIPLDKEPEFIPDE